MALEILSLGLGVAFSPVPIAALILVLMTPQGRGNSLCFLSGWMLGLAGLSIFVIGFVAELTRHGEGSSGNFGGILNTGFGVALLMLSWRTWGRRPRSDDELVVPRWMRNLDQLGKAGTIILGGLLGLLNLKNLPITIEAAVILGRDTAWGAGREWLLCAFVAVSTTGLMIPVAVFWMGGERTSALLERWRLWLCRYNATVLFWLFLILGLFLISKGLARLMGAGA